MAGRMRLFEGSHDEGVDMRILMLNFNKKDHGTYFRSLYLAKELSYLGHRVTMWFVSKDARFKIKKKISENLTIIEGPNFANNILPGGGWGVLDTILRISHLLHTEYDIIHGFEFFLNVSLPILFTQKKKSYLFVSDWCDFFSQGRLAGYSSVKFIRKTVAFYEEFLRRKADGITVISSRLKEKLLSIGIPKQKILLLPGGSPIKIVKPLDKYACRLKYDLDEVNKIIGFLGNSQEDLPLCFEALNIVIKNFPRCKMFIIGNKRSDTTAFIHKYSLQDKVVQSGFLSEQEMNEWLSCCDLFVLPLRDNLANKSRWPNKIGEYLASGRPIVANHVGDISRLFSSYQIGYLADYDPNDFARKIMDILRDDEKAKSMGSSARMVAEKVLSWDILAKELEGFYMRLLELKTKQGHK